MDRRPSLNALLVWAATFYLVTHGMVPPAGSGAETRELAAACCHASGAWLQWGLYRLRGLVFR
jgi:hypothetical protein